MTKSIVLAAIAGTAVTASAQLEFEFVGRYATGIFDGSAAEIVAYDAATQRAFVTNAAANTIDVLSLADPANPALAFSIDLTPFGAGVNSVAVSGGVVAAAVEAAPKQDPGSVVFFDTDGNLLNSVTVGALPDMLTFTPDGNFVLTANEGEPDDDYVVDPEGSVSVIDISGGVASATVSTADFTAFNAGVPAGVRIFGPGATPAQDLEPEYIAVSADSATAYVACQENNALAVVDIASATVTALVPLGFKDYTLFENKLDASNRDSGINFRNWPVFGMYQPDAIAAFMVGDATYIVSANEGDARDYDGFSEEARIRDLPLDPTIFPDAATLQLDENLGRLNSTTTLGDTDGDGDYDELYAYGARSVSIWDATGALVWDSGDDLERITAAALPDDFNSTNDENGSFDNRSDDKGPEPEAVAVAVINGATYAFAGLERVGGIVAFDITDPTNGVFAGYFTSRDFAGDAEAGTAGDLGPEDIVVIDAADSPDGTTLLLVSHEVSGTTAVYRVTATGCNAGDLAEPFGVLDMADQNAFVTAFTGGDADGDLNGDGLFSLEDVLIFVRANLAGCP